jgi:hypothetical protein
MYIRDFHDGSGDSVYVRLGDGDAIFYNACGHASVGDASRNGADDNADVLFCNTLSYHVLHNVDDVSIHGVTCF